MKTLTKALVSMALLTAAFAIGCGSGTGSGDGGDDATGAGGTGGANACPGVTLHGLSTGDSCFDVISIAAGSNDGCMIDVASVVGSSLPVNYDMATATVTVGTMGSLGTGPVMCNMGTLLRENNPTLSTHMACTWHQSDASNITVTATNEFDIQVTEAENQFMGCVAADMLPPTGGMCTSTWTWHLKKGTKTPPGCN